MNATTNKMKKAFHLVSRLGLVAALVYVGLGPVLLVIVVVALLFHAFGLSDARTASSALQKIRIPAGVTGFIAGINDRRYTDYLYRHEPGNIHYERYIQENTYHNYDDD